MIPTVFAFWTAHLVLATMVTTGEGSEVLSHHESSLVHEVNEGGIAILPCPSNDASHLFYFWQRTGSETVLGPGNPIDRTKYKYEVLSGTLLIRAVTEEEAGFYNCVSKGLENQDIYVRPVELVVKKDWEVVWETDYETNLLRGWIAFVVVGAILAGAYFAFRYRRRSSSRFRAVPDEEAQEDSMAGVELTTPSTNFTADGEADTSVVDTDFPKAFNAMYRPMGGVEARL